MVYERILLSVCIIIFMCITPVFCNKDLMVKTQILRNVVAQNPNLIFEKFVTEQFSLEIESIWKRRNWLGNGINYGWFEKTNGYSVGIFPRFYFSPKNTPPKGWYVAGLFRYQDVRKSNFEIFERNSEDSYFVNIRKSGTETGLIFGKQNMNKFGISMEINFGLSYFAQTYTKKLVFGNPQDFNPTSLNKSLKPVLRWVIGYSLF
jgi:hypothetical protein